MEALKKETEDLVEHIAGRAEEEFGALIDKSEEGYKGAWDRATQFLEKPVSFPAGPLAFVTRKVARTCFVPLFFVFESAHVFKTKSFVQRRGLYELTGRRGRKAQLEQFVDEMLDLANHAAQSDSDGADQKAQDCVLFAHMAACMAEEV